MVSLITLIFFILGLIIGSFLNVVIYRYHTAKSLGGRSACMSCRSKLKFYELIPVISYLFLLGRCRTCRTKISIQYPLVELSAGLIFAIVFWKFQAIFAFDILLFVATFLYYVAGFLLLLVIATYDMRHKIIPDGLALAFGILGIVGLFLLNGFAYTHIPSATEFLSGPLVALPFASLWFISRGAWMGFGDAKLALGLGWFLGLSQAISGIVVAFWAGALIGIMLMFMKPKFGMKSEVPFAPFLALGAFVAFIFELHLFPL